MENISSVKDNLFQNEEKTRKRTSTSYDLKEINELMASIFNTI